MYKGQHTWGIIVQVLQLFEKNGRIDFTGDSGAESTEIWGLRSEYERRIGIEEWGPRDVERRM